MPYRASAGFAGIQAFGAIVAALTAALYLLPRGSQLGEAPEIQPLVAPKLSRLPQFQGAYKSQLLWGTYRPGLYFGLRMRLPTSLLFGLMWFDPDRPDAIHNIRHEAQDRDGLRKYGWEAHDGATFGRQELYDGPVQLTTNWTKRMSAGSAAGDWALRLSARNSAGHSPEQQHGDGSRPQRRISLLLYMAHEGGSPVGTAIAPSTAGLPETIMSGSSAQIGAWQLSLDTAGPSKRLVRHLAVKAQHFHNITDLVKQVFAACTAPTKQVPAGRSPKLLLPNATEDGANLAIVQLVVPLPAVASVIFTASPPGDPKEAKSGWLYQLISKIRGEHHAASGAHDNNGETVGVTESQIARIRALSGDALVRLQDDREQAFRRRFEATFGQLHEPTLPQGTAQVARAALSNLLGGMGYFYGSSQVAVKKADGSKAVLQTPPAPLFTAVPSRSFFPRGFLWDEGFHQLLLQKWDARMSREVLAHWLDLINSQGWIAREQILGDEARSRVPEAFVTQQPDAANPPTLFLSLASMAQQVARAGHVQGHEADNDLMEQRDFLIAALPRLQAWFQWFNETQAGALSGSYQWRGRDAGTQQELNPKTLASGLDDFPRASHPSDAERHVDLLAWMALAARALATIVDALPVGQAQKDELVAWADKLHDSEHIAALHLDASRGHFSDWGNHTEDVELAWQMQRGPQGQVWGKHLQRKVTGRAPKLQHVPHFGYVSLFPLLMRLLPPDSHHLQQQLADLRNPALLWTDFGLRSLSKSSSMYNAYNTEHDPPYWRAPIWININYLALASLHFYAQVPGPHQAMANEIHSELRGNVLTNAVLQYQSSGFLWENYDDVDGHGRGSHPFTGWTACIVLVAGQSYLDI